MCLPIKFLKAFAFFSIFLEVGISITVFICAYYLSKLLNQVDDYLYKLGVSFISTGFLSKPFWFLAFGVLIIAICGILGTVIKEKKFFLVIFNAGNLCFCLSFTILAIIAISLDKYIDKDHTCSPTDPQYTEIQSMYTTVEKVLCKDACECYYYKEITPEVSQEVIVYSKTDQTKSINAQECTYFNETFPLDAGAIEWMEQKFDCSGWCIEYPIKMFDDVNSNVKDYKYSCYAAVGNYFKEIFHISGIVFCIIASIMGVMFIFTCCLGYHPDHQHKFKNYKKIQDQKQ